MECYFSCNQCFIIPFSAKDTIQLGQFWQVYLAKKALMFLQRFVGLIRPNIIRIGNIDIENLYKLNTLYFVYRWSFITIICPISLILQYRCNVKVIINGISYDSSPPEAISLSQSLQLFFVMVLALNQVS